MIELRNIVPNDVTLLYQWQGDPVTRKHFFDPRIPTKSEHEQWFERSLNNEMRLLMMGIVSDEPVGLLRYDLLSDEEAEVSIYLDPKKTGMGLGTELLKVGNQWLRNTHKNIRYISAKVLKNNVASLRAFEKSGFKKHYTGFRFEFNE